MNSGGKKLLLVAASCIFSVSMFAQKISDESIDRATGSFSTLSVTGNTVTGSLNVKGNSSIGSITGPLAITGKTTLANGTDLIVTGSTKMYGPLRMVGQFITNGNTTIGNGGDLTVTGSETIYGSLNVARSTMVGADLVVTGSTKMYGPLKMFGQFAINGDTAIGEGGDLTVTGSETIYKGLGVGGDLMVTGTGLSIFDGSLGVRRLIESPCARHLEVEAMSINANTLRTHGRARIGRDLVVKGNAKIYGKLDIKHGINLSKVTFEKLEAEDLEVDGVSVGHGAFRIHRDGSFGNNDHFARYGEDCHGFHVDEHGDVLCHKLEAANGHFKVDHEGKTRIGKNLDVRGRINARKGIRVANGSFTVERDGSFGINHEERGEEHHHKFHVDRHGEVSCNELNVAHEHFKVNHEGRVYSHEGIDVGDHAFIVERDGSFGTHCSERDGEHHHGFHANRDGDVSCRELNVAEGIFSVERDGSFGTHCSERSEHHRYGFHANRDGDVSCRELNVAHDHFRVDHEGRMHTHEGIDVADGAFTVHHDGSFGTHHHSERCEDHHNNGFHVDRDGDVSCGGLKAADDAFIIHRDGSFGTTNCLFNSADLGFDPDALEPSAFDMADFDISDFDAVYSETNAVDTNASGSNAVSLDTTDGSNSADVDVTCDENDDFAENNDSKSADRNHQVARYGFYTDRFGDVSCRALRVAKGHFRVGCEGNTKIHGSLGVRGRVYAHDGLDVARGGLTVKRDGAVIFQDDTMVGTLNLEDINLTTTSQLLSITLPDVENYIGYVDVTFMGDIVTGCDTVEDLEAFSTRYLVSRMDNTKTATIIGMSTVYYNIAGTMSTPASTGSIYAKALSYDSTNPSMWTPCSNTVNIQFLPPTKSDTHLKNVTVLYEVSSGGVGSHHGCSPLRELTVSANNPG